MSDTRAVQTIDYRRTFWGHNHTLRTVSDGVLSGFTWHRRPIREGDHIIWRAEYGEAEGVVTETRWVREPDDMQGVTVRVIERRSGDGELWREDPS